MIKKQKTQNSLSTLEHLPNEVFLEIFSYLNGVDAVFAFSFLNKRFQDLLHKYCKLFDLKSISKTLFDFIFRHHIIKEWKSLKLSDDDDTPGQIKYFFQNYSLINHFPQLKSLSLLNMKLFNLNTLLTQLRPLTNLTSLTIDQFICGKEMSKFNLPNLKKFVVTSCITTDWIKTFSQLKNLEYIITNCCSSQTQRIWQKRLEWPSTLKRLKIAFQNGVHVELVQESLDRLSQLNTLEIYQKEIGRSSPNGKEWEKLIRSSLPLLKTFKFYFQFKYSSYRANQVEQVVESFSTPFYKSEKNWFVRCDMFYEYETSAVLYSLPFPLEQFTIYKSCFPESIPTDVNDNNNDLNNNIYANVKTLVFDRNYMLPDENFKKTKIINLIINTYFNYFDWIHIWTKLRHLEIKTNARISTQDFSFILTDTLNLYSLTIEKNVLRSLTECWNNRFICAQLSRKIHSLKLNSNDKQSTVSSEKELNQIISVFASKCEHLSLCIESQNNTIGLILQNMSQLHSLHVRIQGKNISPITIQWLEQEQTRFNHRNCTIVNNEYDHYFWLKKQA